MFIKLNSLVCLIWNLFLLQKGFPLDASLDTLIAHFEKYAKIDTVYMRRDQDKKFKVKINYLVCTDLISVVLPVNSANFLCTLYRCKNNR